MSLFYLHAVKMFLLDIEFWGGSFSSILKMFHYLLAFMVSDRKSAFILIFVCVVFPLDAFNIFCSLIMICLCMVVFAFVAFEVCSASWICISSNLRSFIFKSIFCTNFLLSFWDFSGTNVTLFDVFSQAPNILFLFPPNLFSLFFRLDNFYWSILKFTMSSSFCSWDYPVSSLPLKLYLSFLKFLLDCFSHFKEIYIFIDFRGRKGEGERGRNVSDERELLIGFLHISCWGSSLRPGHVSWPRIEQWFPGS